MIPLGYVHNLYHFLDRNCFICVYGECRILFALKQLDQFVLYLIKSDRGLVTIDMERE